MCCQSQGTKGALFTSRETAQFLLGVRRVLSPAALPENAHRLYCRARALHRSFYGILQPLCPAGPSPEAEVGRSPPQRCFGARVSGAGQQSTAWTRGSASLRAAAAVGQCACPGQRSEQWQLAFHSAGASRVPGLALGASLRATLCSGNREQGEGESSDESTSALLHKRYLKPFMLPAL